MSSSPTIQRVRHRQLVLVVDDEPSICWAFERLLTGDGHEVVVASTAEDGLRIALERKPDLILLDVRLPREDGITALPKFVAASNAPVIVMTAFGDLETAVSAVKYGASEYLIKPFCLEEAHRACNDALRSVSTANRDFTPVRASQPEDQIIGRSPAIQQAFRQIALVADSDLSVLVTGESGTGKELVAAAIHRHSHRSAGPYVTVSPVALNPDLIESELFGHVAGSFTGATGDRSGLFARAEGGTILLDEIGELPPSIQVKLLRVLEQGEFARVGEVEPRRCNVRVIAATHRDLHQAVVDGRFREDLFYRLNGLHIHLPPLRQRGDDIRELIVHFLRRIDYSEPENAVSEVLVAELKRRPWFGNVRELRNAVQQAAVVARGRSLSIGDFPEPLPGRGEISIDQRSSLDQALIHWLTQRATSADAGNIYDEVITTLEPTIFQFAIRHCGGNRAKAAEWLGIHRGTLREKLRKHGFDETGTS